VKRRWRKPLIVFTPKSLLREPMVMSEIADFCSGSFRQVITDTAVDPPNVSRVLVCSGKVAVDLAKQRESTERDDFAILRVEQLYPLPSAEIEAALETYPEGAEVFWVQEEPRNMGAWYFMKVKWDEAGLQDRWPLRVVSRPESASPSTGSKKMHVIEQQELLAEAIGVPVSG
jgi:2-oxoglutarate dehydrogenase E1 component